APDEIDRMRGRLPDLHSRTGQFTTVDQPILDSRTDTARRLITRAAADRADTTTAEDRLGRAERAAQTLATAPREAPPAADPAGPTLPERDITDAALHAAVTAADTLTADLDTLTTTIHTHLRDAADTLRPHVHTFDTAIRVDQDTEPTRSIRIDWLRTWLGAAETAGHPVELARAQLDRDTGDVTRAR